MHSCNWVILGWIKHSFRAEGYRPSPQAGTTIRDWLGVAPQVLEYCRISHGGQAMTKEEAQRVEELCAQIITEKDEAKFSEAVRQLNKLMETKEERLKKQSIPQA